MANHESGSLNVRLVATGSGTKTVYVALDGTVIATKTVTIDGGTVAVTITPQSHGAHTITAYMEATVDGETKQTDVLRHTGVWLVSGNYDAVVAVYNTEISTTQFATTPIQYMVVTPGLETSSVQLMEGENVLSELTVDRSIQTWAYKATEVGTVPLSIASGTVSEDITLTVASIGYNIAPVTEGLVLDINPEGHANTETNRTEFGYTDGSGVNHPFTFSDNFDWVNGGFQLDEDGVTAFVVKRGTHVYADRSLFNDDAKVDGKHIKLIYKSTMVRDTTAEIISCVSNGIGLSMTAEHATLSTELKNIVTPYCTDKKIEMDITIEAESEAMFSTVYLKGVPSRGMEYTESDRWAQSSPALLKIGSDEADVWIYRVKMYGNALTRREVLTNFVADCADVSEMVDRYERNDVFNSDGSIDMTKLRQKNTKLRVIHIKGAKMTTSKEEDGEVPVDVEMWYTDGGEEHHFIATGVIMKAQGTSSLEYIAAALNLDLDFSDATSWVNGNGEEITEYAFSEGAIGVNYFNLKADVASCEKANNVVNVERYHRYNPFVFKGKALDSRVRDTIEGHPCAVFFTNTSSSTITVGDRTLAAGATMLYFAGNMNNSKKNYAAFGQDNTTYPEQCCVEVMNNNDAECRFKTPIDSSGSWKGLFEFRYPKNPTSSMIARFYELQNWIVSTDTTAATGNSLGQTVTYGETDSLGNEITYTTDSAAYRKAKFIHEVGNYFHTDSLDFHYLYTEFTCGVDNRAKNTFISYEPDANGVWKWCFRNHYDHDTAYGNDNSGGLTFEYGFSELEISCSELLESFTVSFVDYDGTVLNQQTVRQYGSAVNPITAGYISTPTRASTVDTIYTFIGWDVSFNYVLGDLTVTAVYSEAVRTYTVRWWYDAAQTTLLESVSGVEAYSSVDYPGEVLTSDTGAIWMGWDDLTTSVESDMDVHAVFVSPVMPDTVASGYDYLYSDDPDDNSGYSLAEFYGIVSTGNAKSYFNVGDKIKIVPSTTAFKAARAKAKSVKWADADNYEKVFTYENLYRAYKKCRRNVAWKASVQRYISQAPLQIYDTWVKLNDGTYQSPKFFEFDIYERGKKRHIRSTIIGERVVQRCLCDNALVPVIGSTFVHDNGACMKNKGYEYNAQKKTEEFKPYLVKVTASALNIRKGAGTNHPVVGCIRDKGTYTIVAEDNGWGKLKSGAGWISLAYTKRV